MSSRDLKLKDFDLRQNKIKQIGQGTFSRVILAKHKPSQKHYAIKIIETQSEEKLKQSIQIVRNEIAIHS